MYEIKYNYNGEEIKAGKYSLEAARTFAKKTARYAGSCEIIKNGQVIETYSANKETGLVALSH